VSLAVLDERSAMPTPYRKTRSRAADAAWARHTGQAPGRVPEECRREVRSLKRSIEAPAQAIGAAINDRARWCALADAYLKRGALHRERTLAKLRQALAPADVEPRSLGAINSLLVTWLEPREGVVERVEPTFSQAAIVSHAASIIRVNGVVHGVRLIAAEIPDHALARFHERLPGEDALVAIRCAASSFLDLDIRDAIRIGFRRGTLIQPAGGRGVFLSNAIFARERRSDCWRLFSRARTLVLPKADQAPLAPGVDPHWTVLTGSWSFAGKVPGIGPPLAAELDQLEGLLPSLHEADLEECPTRSLK